MKRVRVLNTTRGVTLAESAELADSLVSRFWGLMGRESLAPGEGLVLKPGGSIHMFFMRFPLDVLHVDGSGKITHVLRGINPWRIGPLLVGGALAIELPAGAADSTQPNDLIRVEPLGD